VVFQLECCGSYGPADYHNSAWFNHTPESDGSFVPLSCCGATSHDYYCQFEAMAVLLADSLPHTVVHSQVPGTAVVFVDVLIYTAAYARMFNKLTYLLTYLQLLLRLLLA